MPYAEGRVPRGHQHFVEVAGNYPETSSVKPFETSPHERKGTIMGTSPVVRSTTSALLDRSHRRTLVSPSRPNRGSGFTFRPMRPEAELSTQGRSTI